MLEENPEWPGVRFHFSVCSTFPGLPLCARPWAGTGDTDRRKMWSLPAPHHLSLLTWGDKLRKRLKHLAGILMEVLM